MRLRSIAIGLLLAIASLVQRVCAMYGQSAVLVVSAPMVRLLRAFRLGIRNRLFWTGTSAVRPVQGTMLNRGASLWSATATPSLGLNGTEQAALLR